MTADAIKKEELRLLQRQIDLLKERNRLLREQNYILRILVGENADAPEECEEENDGRE